MKPNLSSPSDMLAQARELWQSATPTVRAALAGGGGFLLILAIGIAFWSATPDYVRVYSGTPSEAQSLAREMDKAGIQYQVSDDGGTLSVKRPDAGRARQLGDGIVRTASAGTGLRGLDSLGPFTTYEVQRERIQRAHEEALETILKQYAGVANAQVSLAVPATNARVGEDVPPKAAVTLTPTPGTAFDESQVAAMAAVIANSVPNLTPENVTIASAEGATLWAGGDMAGAVLGTGTIRARSRAEKDFIRTRQAELQANLDRVFGPRKAVVYVDATLDLDHQETQAKRVVPAGPDGKGLPASESVSTEQMTGGAPRGGATTPGGTTGMAANPPGGVPTYPVANGGDGRGGNYKRSTETTNYDNSTEDVRTTKAVGEPKRMNVSVLVDKSADAAAVKNWVEGAVINPTNVSYTKVSVVQTTFDTQIQKAADAAQVSADRQAWLAAIAPYVVLPGCIALLLFVAWRMTRKTPLALPGRTPELALAGGGVLPNNAALGQPDAPAAVASGANPMPGLTIEEMMGEVPPPSLSSMSQEMPSSEEEEFVMRAAAAANAAAAGIEYDASGQPQRLKPIQEKVEPELEVILDFVANRPETAALLLRSWTVEEPRNR